MLGVGWGKGAVGGVILGVLGGCGEGVMGVEGWGC